MRLADLEKAIQKYVPGIYFRYGGYGDIVGVFHGSDYLIRLSKGEIPISNYKYPDPMNHWGYSKVKGRMFALKQLVNMRWLTSRQAEAIMWGLDED